MAEFIETLQEFQNLPPGQHIFCPREDDDDTDRYEDERDPNANVTVKFDPSRLAKIEATKIRRRKFVSALQLLAYDGKESEQYQKFIWDTLDEALGKCDVCIREYYIAKLDFLEQLRQDYEEDDVTNFFSLINRKDVVRIVRGLDAANETLRNAAEHKRGASLLDKKHLHALFEALVCQAFLEDENKLKSHFDAPFKMVQTRKPLKMREILPAAAQFLFASETIRAYWASMTWKRRDDPPSELEWDWAIKDYLQKKLQQVSDPSDVLKLWSALDLIVSKLDTHTITHKLFDLNPNLATTALNHLAKKTKAVPYILSTLQRILEKAPDALWDKMGSISSQAIIEQVFASPNFNQVLQDSTDATNGPGSDVLSWITSLLDSLKPANRPSASKTLLHQLFERVNDGALSLAARRACFEQAVKVLLKTVNSFSGEDEDSQHPVERLVYIETLDLAGQHLDAILKPRDSALGESLQQETRTETVDLVRNSVALECKCLKLDFENLTRSEPRRQDSSAYTPQIWDAVIANLRDNDNTLSTAALLGIMSLPGLEQFRVKDNDKLVREKKSYNEVFDKVNGMVARILERISGFSGSHMDALFKQQETAMSLVAALFSPDQGTYEAAITMIKNISGEFGRKEALSHLIGSFIGTTVYGICWLFRRVANYKTFSSVPRMLKTGMEILDVLCNPTDGHLRRMILTARDVLAVQRYWSYQWVALKTVFGHTERWSIEVHSKETMKEVCRDAMQYAQELFDQYDLFASIVVKSKLEKAGEIRKTLLDSSSSSEKNLGSPLSTLDMMCKWLRLRDDYLADTLVTLICNMLGQLKRHRVVNNNSEGLTYVEEVAVGTSIRTMLSASQKARLVRALEHYFDRQIEKPVKKQATLNLDKWTGSAAASSRTSTPDSRERSVEEFGDDGIDDDDLIEIANHTLGTSKATVTTQDKNKIKSLLLKQPPAKPKPAPMSLMDVQAKKAQESKSFIENRKREEAARKLREKEAAAKLRGKTGIAGQTAGQGSALAGLGVVGKDHSTGPNSLMVSSESEVDSDDEDEMFNIKSKGPSIQVGSRKPIPTGPVRKVKQQRTQKDIRARLAPDLGDLHHTMLGWDFFADTETPPNSTIDDYTLVTDTFRTPQDYQKTFEPLLVLEAWQSFRSAREDREDSSSRVVEVKVSNSLIVDSFFEINSLMSYAEGKDLGVFVADVVLLSKSSKPIQEPNEPHCLARVKEITRKKGEVQVVYRVNAANNPLRPFLSDKAVVYGVQIQSLTPLEREYGALKALQYYDLYDEIIRAKPSPILDYKDEVLRPIEKTYNLNFAQAKAVKSALDNDAFTLIQGPPGSGKTKTICALVGAMLTGFVKRQAVGPKPNAAHGAPRPPPASKKLLVCAPSNAAVDELVMRFKDGVTMLDGSFEKVSVVRLGRSEAINNNVKDVTLEELVSAKLAASAPKGPGEDIHALMMEHKKVSEELRGLRDSIHDRRGKGENVPITEEQLMDLLQRKQRGLGGKIDDMREKQNTASRDMDLTRKRIQQEILDGAHVLCATLSGSGHELFQGLNVEFETVIIDEAAQSIELSALIPLKYGCSKCILVGDPKQLPPTVLSRKAAKFQYEQSLFARMENNHKKDVHLLDTQYRMHPEISLFPSKTFYDSRLKDGEGMAKLRRRPWHHSDIFAPYRFFDVQGMSQTATKGHSLINLAEITVAMQIYKRLTTDVRKYDFAGKIGIITPYKGQLKELRRRFQSQYGDGIFSKIEFNTTDAFQGRESEIIIFSCVRASTQGIGFLNDIRRMNVGLTRAKCSLWVLGNSQALMQGEFWRALVTDAKERKLYTDGDVARMLNRQLLTDDMMKDDIEMMDSSESLSETLKGSTGGDSSTANAASKDPSPTSVKGVRDAARSAGSSNQSTPLPSRSGSGLSRQSSTSSVKHPEAKRQDSAHSAAKPEPARQDSRSDQCLPRSEQRPASGAPSSKQPQTEQSSSSPGSDGEYAPSGGGNGLNDLHNCGICGSHQHYSSACDNAGALANQYGECRRCNAVGHTMTNCPETRCLSCGGVGHTTGGCVAPLDKRLNKAQQEKVRQEEIRFGKMRDKTRQRRTDKELEAHTIPTIKSTIPTLNGDGAKRKRDESSSSSDRAKLPKHQDSRDPAPGLPKQGQPPDRAPTGPRNGSGAVRPPAGLPPRPPSGPAGQAPRAPGRPGAPLNNGQPMVRKKKVNADDMFVKRK
ncbi:DEAD-box type RNA helicase [Cladophialophora chaetospira]|uniref:DEAD-box type RNA helicase n=1 Tax=Cladophialophora chaetospira TaxID=386627 RepID=A0AA39CCK6_9EURO|nr:DEAD-box type RNA helicase [Cladophialophora chaetospira]